MYQSAYPRKSITNSPLPLSLALKVQASFDQNCVFRSLGMGTGNKDIRNALSFSIEEVSRAHSVGLSAVRHLTPGFSFPSRYKAGISKTCASTIVFWKN
jgi:hypothetical protein